MSRKKNNYSLFAYTADRGTSVAYFLGAIVPLIALGAVVERFVLAPTGASHDAWHATPVGAAGIVALVCSIAALSLGCFFMIRRLVNLAISENRRLAYHDPLTGLPNRRLFKDRLGLALAHRDRQGGLVAVCFLDLDGFKKINDTLGHSEGDRLLQQVADRLSTSVRLHDSLAREEPDESQSAISRMGGDEFTILLTGIRQAEDAGRVARRMLGVLSEAFTIAGREVYATASIGISVAPTDGDTAEELLRNADTAMYAAKERGRNALQFFSSSMNHATERKLDLERRLRAAVAANALTLSYQPIRCGRSGRTTGVEALLRWTDPELGDISPAEFVPVAEDADLIVPIGQWVIRTACLQARAWQDAGYAPIRMSVNLSGQQLRKPGFVETVARALEESGLGADALELEITESTIMQDDEATNEAFRQLYDMGIALALDDFGTGYSSLCHLRRFPIDRVKIDRSFVAGIPGNGDDMAVTAAIVSMAHNLLLKVVGEGVETLEQAESLRELGCDELQGYLFSRAVPGAGIVRFLEETKPPGD
ncbi:MAG: putative bifunctional diguanylate cyclase/phosphodiesterase [Myxococcota bacterium]